MRLRNVILTLILISFIPLGLQAQIIGDQPRSTIRDIHSGATLINGGLWSWHLVNGQMILEMNTASNGGFGTTVQYIALTGGTIDVIQPFTDTTHADATTARHGLIPKPPNDATKFWRGDGTYSAVLFGSSTGVVTASSGATSVTSQLALSLGGTNANLSSTGGTSQVLKQTTTGAAITVARLACADLSDSGTGCSGSVSTTVRSIIIYVPQISNTGSPVTVQVGTGAVATQFPNSADSSVVIPRFIIPPDATSSQSISLTFGYNADSTPGVTNNKFTFKIACTRNGSAVAYTATDTITASNDTNPHTFSGTNTTCGSVSAGDELSVVLYRVVGGTNDAAVPIDVTPVGFRYTSIQ